MKSIKRENFSLIINRCNRSEQEKILTKFSKVISLCSIKHSTEQIEGHLIEDIDRVVEWKRRSNILCKISTGRSSIDRKENSDILPRETGRFIFVLHVFLSIGGGKKSE